MKNTTLNVKSISRFISPDAVSQLYPKPILLKNSQDTFLSCTYLKVSASDNCCTNILYGFTRFVKVFLREKGRARLIQDQPVPQPLQSVFGFLFSNL